MSEVIYYLKGGAGEEDDDDKLTFDVVELEGIVGVIG